MNRSVIIQNDIESGTNLKVYTVVFNIQNAIGAKTIVRKVSHKEQKLLTVYRFE